MNNPPLCPHCNDDRLTIISANEPWHDEHYQCPKCDSTYNKFEFEEHPIEYEWIVKDDDGEPLAYKKPGEDPVMIYPEKAVVKCIETIKSIQSTLLSTQNLLADLSRHL